MELKELPWEILEEEILSRLPVKSIARFRSVSKRWNTLLNNMRFLKNNLSHTHAHANPQFILLSESKFCSVEVNLNGPSVEVHNLPSDISGFNISLSMTVEYCDGLLVYATCQGIGICNPWLRQIRWIESNIGYYDYNGMGYDKSRSDNHYKILGSHQNNNTTIDVNVTELGSDAWKFYKFASDDWRLSTYLNNSVSLNGTLYWVAYNQNSREHFIQSFDFSMERFNPLCVLPSKTNIWDAVRALEIFRRDRLSVLELDYKTRNMEIWVTKKKIENRNGEAVEWMKFMSVSVLKQSSIIFNYTPSYFIDDKSLSLVLCSLNKKGKTCIYIAKGDRFHEIEIKDVVDCEPRHRAYFRSLIPVPTTMDTTKAL